MKFPSYVPTGAKEAVLQLLSRKTSNEFEPDGIELELASYEERHRDLLRLRGLVYAAAQLALINHEIKEVEAEICALRAQTLLTQRLVDDPRMRDVFSHMQFAPSYEAWWADFFDVALCPDIRGKAESKFEPTRDCVRAIQDLSLRLKRELRKLEALDVDDDEVLTRRASLFSSSHVRKLEEIERRSDGELLNVLGIEKGPEPLDYKAFFANQTEFMRARHVLSSRTADILADLNKDAAEFLKVVVPDLRTRKATRATVALRAFTVLLNDLVKSATKQPLQWSHDLGHAFATTCEVIIDDPGVVITYDMARKVIKPLLADGP